MLIECLEVIMVILQFEFNEIVQNWMVSCIISLFGFLFVVRAI